LHLSFFLRSSVVQPGNNQGIILPHDVVVTNIALGDEIADESSRTTVKLAYIGLPRQEDSEDEGEDEGDDEESKSGGEGEIETTVLCSLTPGKVCCSMLWLR